MLKSLAPFFIIISLLQIIFPKEEKGLISQSEDFEEIDIDLEIEQEYLLNQILLIFLKSQMKTMYIPLLPYLITSFISRLKMIFTK